MTWFMPASRCDCPEPRNQRNRIRRRVCGNTCLTATFAVGTGPMPDIATDPSTHSAYVMSSGDDSLYVVDAQSRTATIKVGKSPGFVAVDENTQTAYVPRGNTVSSVDIASGSITGTIAVGNDPEGIEVDPSTRTVYVANVADGTVSVIDAGSPRQSKSGTRRAKWAWIRVATSSLCQTGERVARVSDSL